MLYCTLRRTRLKLCETTKLFWDEYPYKLVLKNKTAHIFRNKNLSYARQILDKMQTSYVENQPLCLTRGFRMDTVTEQQFLDSKKLLHFFSSRDDYRLRIELAYLSIYSFDLSWLNTISKSLGPGSVKELWQPGSNTANLLSKNTVILQENLGYNYRITLGRKSSDTSAFANFVRSNSHLVRVGPVLMNELENNGYVNGMYFYARDDKTIQLCHLMLDNIRRIDKIIYKHDVDK